MTLQEQLCEKMRVEQSAYCLWLTAQPPEEILHHAYEYSVREDIILRHCANRPCPQRPRCQPARARLHDLFRRRGHLLCKGYFGYDSVSDAVSLTFMLNKRIIFSVKVNSREGVCYGFYNEDYRVGFPK